MGFPYSPRLALLLLSLVTTATAATCGRSLDDVETVHLSLSSQIVELSAGENAEVLVTLETQKPLSAPIVLSVGGPADAALPSGLQAAFDPVAATPAPDHPATTRLRLTATPTAVDDQYTLVVHGKGQFPAEMSSANLTVNLTGMATTWRRPISTPATEQLSWMAADRSGGVVVGLYTDGALAGGQNQGAFDGYIMRYRSNGAVAWVQRLATMSADIVACLAVDDAENVYVAGYTYGAFPGQASAGKADAYVAKLGPDGTLAWLRQFGTAEIDQLNAIAVGTDGSIYAAGLTEGAFPTQTSAGGSDVFVVKLRPDGSQEWLRQFGTDQKERTDAVPEDRSVALTLDSAGDLYIVGSTQGTFAGETSAGLGDAFITRMDASGKQAWLHQFGSVSHDALLAVTPNPAGGVYAVGWAKGPVGNQIQLGGQDALLVAYRPDGTRLFVRQLGTTYADALEALTVYDGKLYVIGSTRGAFAGQSQAGVQDVFMMQLASDGTTLWLRQLGTPQFDRGTAVAATSDYLYVAGATFGAFEMGATPMGSDGFLQQYLRQ